MAKTTKDAAAAVEETTKQEVVTTTGANVPAFFNTIKQTGAGNSTAAADNIIPRISLLQGLSPQVQRQNSEYIEGAEPGAFWLRISSPAIVAGEEGFDFQPVHTDQYIAEWVPRARGGGLVNKHVIKTDDRGRTDIAKSVPGAVEKPHPTNAERTIWVTSTGNELIETREVAGFVRFADGSAAPYVLTATGTNHTPFKNWQTARNFKQVNGQRADAWMCYYRIKSKMRTKNNNNWFIYNISDADCGIMATDQTKSGPFVSTIEEYNRGKELHEAFATGAVSAEAAQEGTDDHAAPIDNNGAM
jgi:hypothetical protein